MTAKERWISQKKAFGFAPDIDEFIKDIAEVCKKHNMSISHEDGHGAFLINEFDMMNIAWLNDAHDDRDKK